MQRWATTTRSCALSGRHRNASTQKCYSTTRAIGINMIMDFGSSFINASRIERSTHAARVVCCVLCSMAANRYANAHTHTQHTWTRSGYEYKWNGCRDVWSDTARNRHGRHTHTDRLPHTPHCIAHLVSVIRIYSLVRTRRPNYDDANGFGIMRVVQRNNCAHGEQ